MSVIEMKRTLSQEEYLGWYVYLTNKPPDHNEIQMATLMAMVANMFGGKSKPKDFMVSQHTTNRSPKSTAFDSFDAIATDYDSRKK